MITTSFSKILLSALVLSVGTSIVSAGVVPIENLKRSELTAERAEAPGPAFLARQVSGLQARANSEPVCRYGWEKVCASRLKETVYDNWVLADAIIW